MKISLQKKKQRGFQITELTLKRPDLPAAFEGYRMVQISDLHFGTCTSRKHIDKALHLVESAKPDLLFVTGDFLQYTRHGMHPAVSRSGKVSLQRARAHRPRILKIAQELHEITAHFRATDGVVAVYGNHEYLEGVRLIRRHVDKKVIWLVNESLSVSRDGEQIRILGIDDIRKGKPDLKRSFQRKHNLGVLAQNRLSHTEPHQLAEPCMHILLSHNPDFVLHFNAQDLEQVDLALCGHTHGGQVCLPGGKPIVSRTKQRNHLRGLSWEEDLAIYTTNGVGYGGIGIRSFCPPEIVVMTLTRGTGSK